MLAACPACAYLDQLHLSISTQRFSDHSLPACLLKCRSGMKVFAREFSIRSACMCTHTDTHTHTYVRSGSIQIHLYPPFLSAVFLDMMFVNILLIITADFDEKNTDEKRACRHNLRILCISNTPPYTIVTMLSVKRKQSEQRVTVSLFSTIPLVLYIYLTVRRQMWNWQANPSSDLPSTDEWRTSP
jgi:hypothetical protein